MKYPRIIAKYAEKVFDKGWIIYINNYEFDAWKQAWVEQEKALMWGLQNSQILPKELAGEITKIRFGTSGLVENDSKDKHAHIRKRPNKNNKVKSFKKCLYNSNPKKSRRSFIAGTP